MDGCSMGAGRLGGAGKGAANGGADRAPSAAEAAPAAQLTHLFTQLSLSCQVGRVFNAQTVKDSFGRPVLLFRNAWGIDQLLGDSPDIGPLSAIGLPPSAAELAASRK